MLTALAQEPWCWHPEQIASLTDWQVMNMYLRPAAKRAKEMRESIKEPEAEKTWDESPEKPTETVKRKPTGPVIASSEDPHPPIGSPEFREYIIGQFMSLGAMSREKAEAEYERQKDLPPLV